MADFWSDFGPTFGRLLSEFWETWERLLVTLDQLLADFGILLGRFWADFWMTSGPLWAGQGSGHTNGDLRYSQGVQLTL